VTRSMVRAVLLEPVLEVASVAARVTVLEVMVEGLEAVLEKEVEGLLVEVALAVAVDFEAV
jgi:hypothetical protein